MPLLNLQIKYLFNRFVRIADLSFASGIPTPSLSRYKRLGIIPTGTNFNKMMKLYRETQYRSLRTEGVSVVEAKKYWSKSPSVVNTIRNKYAETVIRLADFADVDESLILENISNSEKEAEEIFESGL